METIRSFQNIVAFVKAAESGSFSKAAQILGVSKSHISKAIGQLEYELGMSLFLRTTRKVQLTNLGQRYFETCKQAIESLDSARREIQDMSDSPRGILRVTMAGMFGENYVAPVLIEMAKKYPDLRVELDFSTRTVDLIEEKFDVAIRVGQLKDSSLIAQKIASRVEYVVCSKKYLDNAPPLKEPGDLTKHNCIGESLSWNFEKKGKPLRVAVNGNFKSNNPRVLKNAALAGVGLARLPGAYVFEEIKKGRLVSVLENYYEGRKNIWILTPPQRAQNINAKLFIEELKKHLSRGYADAFF